jgi:hypothetical protein
MWKNIVQPDRPQMTIWRMRIACWMPEATNTLSEYVNPTAFSMQEWCSERALLLHYMYIVLLFLWNNSKMAFTSFLWTASLMVSLALAISAGNRTEDSWGNEDKLLALCAMWRQLCTLATEWPLTVLTVLKTGLVRNQFGLGDEVDNLYPCWVYRTLSTRSSSSSCSHRATLTQTRDKRWQKR